LQIATGTVQEGGWVGQTCRGHWSPVVAHAALYQATGWCSSDHTEAVR